MNLPRRGHRRRAGTTVWVLLALIRHVWCIRQCSTDRGGGICPDENTCCLYAANAGSTSKHKSGCLPSTLGARYATCCHDGTSTGCGMEYACGPEQTCVAIDNNTDPLLQILPRHRLCYATDALRHVHGMAMKDEDAQDLTVPLLPYYSSHGSLDQMAPHSATSEIRMALIVVHGAARNADEYFCFATSTVELQHRYTQEQVLVLAPWFASTTDGPTPPEDTGHPALEWHKNDWRFGANAVNVPNTTKGRTTPRYSAFYGVDRLVQSLKRHHLFDVLPRLERIVVAGHSAGGQYVQRWALLSPHAGDDAATAVTVHSVVANPSSYAYLVPQRWIHEQWQVPPSDSCTRYNDWEWGLNHTTTGTANTKKRAPIYVRAVRHSPVGASLMALATRFASRRVVYLAGGQDVCNVPGNRRDGWCYSHGLETTCMDLCQGRNRLERHMHYYASLQRMGIVLHERGVAWGVGHDHALMFQSAAGIRAIYHGVGDAPCRTTDSDEVDRADEGPITDSLLRAAHSSRP